ncbi:MAG: hypothetical protein ACOC1F_06615 [Myxococcota bacterium]
MQVDTHRERLSDLGLDATSYRALLMLPIVYVVWADRRLYAHTKARGLYVAEHAFGLNRTSMQVVRDWLTSPPEPHIYRQGFEELRSLVRAVDEPQFDTDMVRLSLSHAEALARANVADPNFRGAPRAVSAAERQALRIAASALGVDIGSTWADVVESLDGDGVPTRPPLGSEEHEVEEGAVSTRFDSSPPPESGSERPRRGTMRHLKTALRTKDIERNTTAPQLKGGKI